MDIKGKANKLLSFALAIIMVLGTLVGYVPVNTMTVQAASSATLQEIKKGTDITNIPGISFDPVSDQMVTFKFNKSAGYIMYNISGKLLPWIKTPEAASSIRFQNMNTLNGKKPAVVYYHVAKNKRTNNFYNLRIDVTNWKASSFTWKDPNGNKVPPYIGFSTKKIGFYMQGIEYAECKYTYLVDDGSGGDGRKMTAEEKEKFFSYVTLCDLDFTQAFSIGDQPGLKGVFKIQGNDNIYQKNGVIVSQDKWSGGEISDSTPAGWVTVYMEKNDSMSLTFHDQQKNLELYGPGDTPTKQLTNNLFPTPSHYGFSMQTIFSIPNPKEMDLKKKVGDKGVAWDDADKADSPDIAYEIDDYHDFDYLLQSTVQTAQKDQTSYIVTDTLEDCLQIDDAAHVSITDKDGKNVTGNFDVKVNGQTITCSAKKDYFSDADSSFYEEGQNFTIRMTVHRKKVNDIKNFMQAWIDPEDGYTFYVPNAAKMQYVSAANGTYDFESHTVWVTDTIDAALKVEKDSKYDGWKVGDQVEYAVEVTQTKQDGYAVNVEITDEDIPPYLQLINGSWEVSGPNSGTAASMSSSGENGWKVTCPLLQYGDSIVIKFKCLALTDSNGKDTINTAQATADNFVNEDGEQRYAGDDAEVWVNSPELTVDKVANAYEYQVGDKVQYTVTVRNTKDYTVAENVIVSDISLPEGLEINEDSADGTGVRVTMNPETAATQIGWPVPDGTTAIAKQQKENRVTVDRAGNTWSVLADYLPSDATMTIAFDCVATKYVNGIETQNQVAVTAGNFLDAEGNQRTAQDDAEVYVNTAAFSIDKHITDGNYEWQVGDHVPFDVIVRNINDENTQDLAETDAYFTLPEEEKARIGAAGKTVARNVVITDSDIPEGFRLDTDTVSVEAVPQDTYDYPEEMESSQDEYAAYYPEEAPEEYPEESIDEQYPEENVNEGYTEESEYIEETDIPETYGVPEEENLEGNVETEPSYEENYNEDPEGYALVQEKADSYDNQDYEGYDSEYEGYSNEYESYDNEYKDYDEEYEGYDMEVLQAHEPRPAEQMTVEGIPDSYDNHVAGTPDTTNQLNPELYNETVTTPITWNLETVGNGWQLKITDLPAGHDVRVHFTCEALEASNGQEGVNIGNVTADNAISKSDDSEAYINTAALTINKELINRYAAGGEEDKQDGREPYEFRVGEDIVYRVTVHNIQPGSIARNLVISDLSLPEGLVLSDGDGAITVEGIPAEYVNPIAGTDDMMSQLDPDHYNETEVLPVSYQLVREGTGWQLLIDNMPCTENDVLNQWGQPIVINFHCTATEDVNGWEIINTAKASADNAAEVKDSERIWINSPVLQVNKKADKDEYLVGDTITYQVDMTQEQIGCVARNIVISDAIDTDGVKLQKNSIVLLDKEGHKFNIPDENISVTGNSFIIYTGMHLIKEQGYNNWDAENGGLTVKGPFNPLNIDKESKLTLEYAVEVVDRSLAGQMVHNKVSVNSHENIPKEDETEVPIDGPALDIVKESDKAEYLVGETGVYKLTIRQLREGVTAKQVVIKDSFNMDGVVIQPDTLSVRMNGEEITDAKITVNDTSFTIETGRDLTVEDKIEVIYRVLFASASLDGQYVVNTATAKGSNTKEEKQDNTVIVVDETPSLSISKKSDKQYYKVGETGHYTVKVTQTAKGATARNVVIKDNLYMDGVKIVPGTITIRNDAGRVIDEAEIEYSDTRYAIYTGRNLEYNETFTVTYDVLFESASLAGKDILNVVRTTCDNNRIITNDPGPIEITDGLTVYKSADPVTGSLVEKGNVITYSITVRNTSDKTKDTILIKDRIPDYTEYVQDSAVGDNVVAAGAKELQGQQYAAFVIQNLAAGAERTVSFQVKVKADAPEDGMIMNVGQVRETKVTPGDITDDTWNHQGFRNTNETVHYLDTRWVKDSNTVRIDGGSLSIEKTSDKANYAVGEIGHYTLTITQRKDGAVSKNVIISDSLKDKGAVIQTNTIKVMKDGQGLPQAEIDAKETGFTIRTNADLAYGEQMTVTYDVLFKDASLAGKTVRNVAIAKGDETPEGEEPKDDNTVTVGKAGLDIRKTSDKKEYKVGDIAHYTLEVRTTADDFTAENVVIKDVMKQQGANLVAGTVKVFLDEKRLDKVDVQEIDNGFVISTHTNLSGAQVMKVTYDVTMEKASLAGRDIQNVATADADNTDPVDTTHNVTIPKKVDPDVTPTPSGTPGPTPTPDEKGEPILTISKKTDKSEAKPGSTVQYTIEVKNTGNATAEDVVIIDNLKNNKAILQKDTIKAYLQDKEFKPKKLSAVSSGFRMETGQDLKKGQVIRVIYQVKLDATLKSSEIRNVASASAQNADRTETENTLNIPSNGTSGTNGNNNDTNNPKDTSSSLKGNVQTGDRSPVKLIVIIGIIGLAGLIAYFRGRRKGRK